VQSLVALGSRVWGERCDFASGLQRAASVDRRLASTLQERSVALISSAARRWVLALVVGSEACALGAIHDRESQREDRSTRDATSEETGAQPSADAGWSDDARAQEDSRAVDGARPDVVLERDSAVTPSCTPACGANAYCTESGCRCSPGFEMSGGSCVPGSNGTDPATHSESEVCRRWTEGHVQRAAERYVPGPTMCDPGVVPRPAIDDALVRTNMFRWLVGLGPVSDDPREAATTQACAVLQHRAGWPGPSNPTPHSPAPSLPCYSTLGASGSSSSNIAWGVGSAADAVDLWIEDRGNERTLGHRRWILNPPLGPVSFGFYGDASCMSVFGMSGSGTSLEFIAYPPPGPVPVETTAGFWSFTGLSVAVTSSTTVSMRRLSDGTTATVELLRLSGALGTSGSPIGWIVQSPRPTAGDLWQVTLHELRDTSGMSRDLSYTVRIVRCS
jgi:hypothetical protein